jgi:hypothetical protein
MNEMERKISAIKFNKLLSDKNNPRGTTEEISEMAISLKSNGQLKPIDVEDLENGKFLVTDGNRRYAGFEKIAKDDKTNPDVDCIVYNEMTPMERLIKQVQIENQQKSWNVPNRDKAWEKIWKQLPKEKQEKLIFAKLIGTSPEQISHFFDRQNLDVDLKKLNINAGLLQETKHIPSKSIRKKVLIKAHKDGDGAMALRNKVNVLKKCSEDLVDSWVEGNVTIEQLDKIKDLPKNKQDTAIATITSMKKYSDDVPKLVADNKLKDEKINPKMVTTQEFVSKLQREIANSVGQFESVKGIIEYIEEEELDKLFNAKMKLGLSTMLEELQKSVKPSVELIEKTIKKWQK